MVPQTDARRGRRRRSRSSRPSDSDGQPNPGPSGNVQRGVIKWFNRGKGYGFIRCQDGTDVFVHESAAILGTNDAPLAKGREVEFELRQTSRGSQAFSVVVLGESAAAETAAGEEDGPPGPPAIDMSRKLPASWQRPPAAFVYTYTIYGRRHE